MDLWGASSMFVATETQTVRTLDDVTDDVSDDVTEFDVTVDANDFEVTDVADFDVTDVADFSTDELMTSPTTLPTSPTLTSPTLTSLLPMIPSCTYYCLYTHRIFKAYNCPSRSAIFLSNH